MTSAEKAAHRARAQTLPPAVRVGHDGVTPVIIKELDTALRRADLVKIRFAAGRELLRAQSAELAAATNSACVGGVGRVASFFRPRPAPKS
ncbi:MAG: YhbY family RNA-binding protein [Opitutales bacterium]|jgi:RNA-binding protein YhbY